MEPVHVTRAMMPDREEFDHYIDQIFASAQLTNNGPLVTLLEQRLKSYLGVRNIVLVSSGTMALQLAYKLAGLTEEVITSPFSFVATSSTLAWQGLDISFADINPLTLNIDPAQIEKAISPRTSGIVPVHIFGNPCEVEKIQEIAKNHDLKVVYDASHCFGVKYKGESILNWGDISTLSFHATKLFHTIEGGALIINDDDLCTKARKMINFGITGPESIECLGINAKMNEFQAAMGLSLLSKIDAAIQKRKVISESYTEIIGDCFTNQKFSQDCFQNYSYYPLIFDDEESLVRMQVILNSHHIYPRRYFYTSLNELEFLSKYQSTPHSESISKRILCLPISPDLSVEKFFSIAKLIYFNKQKKFEKINQDDTTDNNVILSEKEFEALA